MSEEAWHKSIVLITSSAPEIKDFGTGFVIAKDEQHTYILTCAHVIQKVGSRLDKLEINHFPERVTFFYIDNDADLAVLCIGRPLDMSPLPLRVASKKGKPFNTAGFQLEDQRFLIRPLTGRLIEQVGIQAKGQRERIGAWDLKITGEFLLQPGHSGSPVVDTYKNVIAVVKNRRGDGKTGVAISIEALKLVWPDMPASLFAQENAGPTTQNIGKLVRKVLSKSSHATENITGNNGSQGNVNTNGPAQPPPVFSVPLSHEPTPATTPISKPAQAIPHRHTTPKTLFLRALTVAVVLTVIISSILISTSINRQNATNYAQDTATVNSIQNTATAVIQDTSTAIAQATTNAIAQAGHPYGGTLAISDPMDGSPSDFNWDTGNDSAGNQCNFQGEAYLVSGACQSNYSIPINFVFEIQLVARQSCGAIDFKDSDIILFWVDVCQHGDYNLASSTNSQHDSTSSINTELGASNTIDIVADGTNITLYINNDQIANIPDNMTSFVHIILWGIDLNTVLGINSSSASDPNDYREVVYDNARLWTL